MDGAHFLYTLNLGRNLYETKLKQHQEYHLPGKAEGPKFKASLVQKASPYLKIKIIIIIKIKTISNSTYSLYYKTFQRFVVGEASKSTLSSNQ